MYHLLRTFTLSVKKELWVQFQAITLTRSQGCKKVLTLNWLDTDLLSSFKLKIIRSEINSFTQKILFILLCCLHPSSHPSHSAPFTALCLSIASPPKKMLCFWKNRRRKWERRGEWVDLCERGKIETDRGKVWSGNPYDAPAPNSFFISV